MSIGFAIKEGVDVSHLKPPILLALQIAKDVYDVYEAELVITDGMRDPKKGPKSLHRFGYAVDLRIWDFADGEVGEVVTELQQRLGKQFQVFEEVDHIHIEFDPKS